jgi:hypothetical protein
MSDGSSLPSVAIHVHVIALALTAAGICWAALLAGLSRQHWFWRVSFLCLPLLLLMPIRAYEPLVLVFPLVIALAVTAAGLRVRWERESRGQTSASAGPDSANSGRTGTKKPVNRWSISLGDSLLGMTVIGAMLAILVQLPWNHLNLSWSGLLFDATLLYLISLVCLCLVGLRGGLIWAVALFLCISTGIVFEATWGDGLRAMYLIGVAGPQHLTWAPLGEFYLLFTTLLLLGLWLIRWCSSALPEPQSFVKRRRLVASLVAVAAAPVLALYIAMFVGPAEVPSPKIRNNSLPQLVEVAQQLQTLGIGDLTLRELQQHYPLGNYDQAVEEIYAHALELVKQPGSVSLDVSLRANDHSLSAQEAQLLLLRSLARRWSREADQAYRGGDIRRAAEFDLAVLRMGNYLSRGGIRIHVQAAAAIKSEGLSHLAILREHLPIDLIPVVISVLEQLDAGEESPQVTNVRDRYWTDIAHGWRHRLESVVQRVLRLPTTETAAFHALKQPLAREAAQRRLLGTELALRHFHQEHGRYPATLAELVPARLALLPRDPFTKDVLRYRTQRFSFVLYSTGPDAQDDGGNFSRFGGDPNRFVGHDWNLEAVLRFGGRMPRGRGPGSGWNGRGGSPPGRWTAPPWEQSQRRSPPIIEA